MPAEDTLDGSLAARHATTVRGHPNGETRSFQTVLILLILVAGALGWSQVARADRGSSTGAQLDTAPRLKAYGGLARRGFRVYFAYRLQDDGTVTVRASVRIGRRLARSATLKHTAPYWERRYLWKPKPISTSFPAGVYTYCVDVTDDAGHHKKSCASYAAVSQPSP